MIKPCSLIKKVVIIGPESTGKSTLCQKLSAHFNAAWCPEFARTYLTQHGKEYTYDNLLTIAKGQLQMEDAYSMKAEAGKDKPLLFIDTDMYVMKVWCEFVFGKCHQWILDRITERKYDLYLLCKPDLPWAKDDLREYPDETRRLKLYDYYKDAMVHQSTPWIEISGGYEERLQKAVDATQQILS